MTETAIEAAVRMVEYVDPDVRAALPRRFPAAWVAEESLRPLEEAAAGLDAAGRDDLAARAGAFLDEVLFVLKADVLPYEPERCLFLDAEGRFHLVGPRAGRKVRVDADLNVAIVRERPETLEGPRAGSIRVELREVLCIPLASAAAKPVAAVRTKSMAPLGEPGGFFIELGAPEGGGYVRGRYERLQAYSDGKVLLFGFREPDLGLAAGEEGGGAAGAAAGAVAGGGGAGSDESPFNNPGWAAACAPVLPE